MEWSDSGSILGLRPHGETAALVEVITAQHGRHAGILRGGASRRRAADLQPGTRVVVNWRARLSEHLGVFTLEAERGRAARGRPPWPGRLIARPGTSPQLFAFSPAPCT